ncbi:MAG: AAA family ATPase [Planctomycetaceae bacterium]|jgi:capsular exopolysaccharide synthesis family protein|nr:AAA family ATPase [Planctomycetaceae bacterium]
MSVDNFPPQGSSGTMSGFSGTQTGVPTQNPQFYSAAYSAPPQENRPKPEIDSAESAKMTPQILILLITTGLKRTWKWAFPTGIVLGAVTFAVMYLLFPIKYEAAAWLQILSVKPKFVFNDTDGGGKYDSFMATQFATFRSPFIIDKALENPDVARLPLIIKEKDKRAWFQKNLNVSQQAKSEMVTVSVLTEVPKDAEIIVNAVVTAFFEDYASRSNDWNARLLTQLNLELSRQQTTAKILQDEIRSGLEQAASKGGAAGGKEGGIAGGLAQGESLVRDMYLGESKLFALQAERDMLRETAEGGITIPDAMLAQALENDPTLRVLQTRKEELKTMMENVRKNLPRPDDPKVLNYQDQIRQIEKQIEDYTGGSDRTAVADVMQRQIRVGLEQQIWAKDMEIKSAEIMYRKLNERYKEQLSNSVERTTKSVDVSFQQEQLKRVNGVLDLLQQRITSLQTEKNAPDQIQLRRKATIPTEPKVKNRLPLAAMGGAGCFFFPFLLGIAVERLRPRLYHVSQIRRGIPSVLIGEIMEPPVAWVHGPTFRKRLARYRESVHNWCTHLLLSYPFNQCKTLSVASVAGDDGKTFLAVQIAVAMAQMKSGPVLLIDADMRVGRLHLLFGNEETGVGLADVLSFRNGFGEAVVLNEREPNLHLLSAGQLDVSPYELLGDGRFRELLDTLESHYSLIIVVLPPVANAAESLMMSASTDSTLLCVRQGETVLAAMEDVFRKLVNTGSRVDSIVVKDIPYSHMAGKDGGFADKLEQIRLAHLLQYAD